MHSFSTLISSISSLTIFFMFVTVFGASNMDTRCKDTDIEALLSFKRGLTDPSRRLSSWIGVRCCQWRGVQCNNISGNVIKLDLRNPFPSGCFTEGSCLGGKLNSSLLKLRHLTYLDLSLNYFDETEIPEFFGTFKNLRYLNLSSSGFEGNIPPHLGNLTKLKYLDLYSHSLATGSNTLSCVNMQWISGLTSLKHLNLGQVDMQFQGPKLLKVVNMLSSLEELHLHSCSLYTLPKSLPFVNLTSLLVLDLSLNSFEDSLPKWLFNLTSLIRLDLDKNGFSGHIHGGLMNFPSLQYLDFSDNNFDGDIQEFFDGFTTVCPNNSLVTLDFSRNWLEGYLPESLGMLQNLKQLRLVRNEFWGAIPATIGNMSHLEELNLSFNLMNGTIPSTLGQLSRLKDLNLEGNFLHGVVTEIHLKNLTTLKSLSVNNDATNTDRLLVFNVSSGWVPPFRLKYLDLGNCLVGPTFPLWLRVQNQLDDVNIHNAGIEDIIPEQWFSIISSQLINLDLSNNRIKGKLPHKLQSQKAVGIDLSNNQFDGALPLWSTNSAALSLQNNLFSGTIPTNISNLMPNLQILNLSGNFLNGTIPSSMCALPSLRVLSLRSNQLSRKLPKCWNNDKFLSVLSAIDVANNNISGKIPSSFGDLGSLEVLVLSNNNLDGEIPPSLRNCSMKILDLGGNHLSGDLPAWIGNVYPYLWILSLRSNAFNGTIPMQWCEMSSLHILDLAHNNLHGVIPNCLSNITSLQTRPYFDSTNKNGISSASDYFEQMLLVKNGRELEFSSNLKYVNSIDLSGNKLIGDIPKGITNLIALDTLNLSMNSLTGSIPEDIGNLTWLETLDLSQNHLSGHIPQSILSLNFLSHFNVSYNNLVGRIPYKYQLATFNEASIYEGNPSLCGLPLPNKCEDDADNVVPVIEGFEEFDYETLWFYMFGYVVGLCGVFFTLWRKHSWRRAYYRLLQFE